MLTEQGRIVAVETAHIWVETLRRGSCDSCQANSACGHGLMNKLGSRQCLQLKVALGDIASGDCQVNDEVTLALPEAMLVKGALLVYIMPLITLLAGAMLGQWGWQSEAGALLGALLGLAAGFALLHLHHRRHRNDPLLQPRLLSVRRPSLSAADDAVVIVGKPL